MYFDIKSYLKSNRNHTAKHILERQIRIAIIIQKLNTNWECWMKSIFSSN